MWVKVLNAKHTTLCEFIGKHVNRGSFCQLIGKHVNGSGGSWGFFSSGKCSNGDGGSGESANDASFCGESVNGYGERAAKSKDNKLWQIDSKTISYHK